MIRPYQPIYRVYIELSIHFDARKGSILESNLPSFSFVIYPVIYLDTLPNNQLNNHLN